MLLIELMYLHGLFVLIVLIDLNVLMDISVKFFDLDGYFYFGLMIMNLIDLLVLLVKFEDLGLFGLVVELVGLFGEIEVENKLVILLIVFIY